MIPSSPWHAGDLVCVISRYLDGAEHDRWLGIVVDQFTSADGGTTPVVYVTSGMLEGRAVPFPPDHVKLISSAANTQLERK